MQDKIHIIVPFQGFEFRGHSPWSSRHTFSVQSPPRKMPHEILSSERAKYRECPLFFLTKIALFLRTNLFGTTPFCGFYRQNWPTAFRTLLYNRFIPDGIFAFGVF